MVTHTLTHHFQFLIIRKETYRSLVPAKSTEVGDNYRGLLLLFIEDFEMGTMTASLLSMNNVPSEAFPRYNTLPDLSVTKRSWVVKTESNVWKEETKKPNPPCVVCGGRGKVNCCHCRGRGRTNCVNLAMLPKGEWPKWCKTCRGSGLDYCSRCLGTGEYKDRIGFHFTKKIAGDKNDQKKNP